MPEGGLSGTRKGCSQSGCTLYALCRVLAALVLDGHHQVAARRDGDRKGGESFAVIADGTACGDVELVGVEGADNGAAAQNAVDQRAAAMGAAVLRGVDLAGARAEDRHHAVADAEDSAFTKRHAGLGSEVNHRAV